MPEVVHRWVATRDVAQVDGVLSDLLVSYTNDFAKHGGAAQFAKISLAWNSLPSQLARENKKFMWGLVREGARAREYEDAVSWLVEAGLIRKIPLNDAKGVPVSVYDSPSAFKVYCLDVGLLRRLSRLDATVFSEKTALFAEFKGAFAENYVLQALVPQLDASPRYWTNEKPRHEVDFLIQVGNELVPVEVKSGEVVHSASLKYYAKKTCRLNAAQGEIFAAQSHAEQRGAQLAALYGRQGGRVHYEGHAGDRAVTLGSKILQRSVSRFVSILPCRIARFGSARNGFSLEVNPLLWRVREGINKR